MRKSQAVQTNGDAEIARPDNAALQIKQRC